MAVYLFDATVEELGNLPYVNKGMADRIVRAVKANRITSEDSLVNVFCADKEKRLRAVVLYWLDNEFIILEPEEEIEAKGTWRQGDSHPPGGHSGMSLTYDHDVEPVVASTPAHAGELHGRQDDPLLRGDISSVRGDKSSDLRPGLPGKGENDSVYFTGNEEGSENPSKVPEESSQLQWLCKKMLAMESNYVTMSRQIQKLSLGSDNDELFQTAEEQEAAVSTARTPTTASRRPVDRLCRSSAGRASTPNVGSNRSNRGVSFSPDYVGIPASNSNGHYMGRRNGAVGRGQPNKGNRDPRQGIDSMSGTYHTAPDTYHSEPSTGVYHTAPYSGTYHTAPSSGIYHSAHAYDVVDDNVDGYYDPSADMFGESVFDPSADMCLPSRSQSMWLPKGQGRGYVGSGHAGSSERHYGRGRGYIGSGQSEQSGGGFVPQGRGNGGSFGSVRDIGSAKLSSYSGNVPWEAFETKLKMVAKQNGWSERDALYKFVGCLEGEALQVFSNIPCQEQECWSAVCKYMKQVFGGGSSVQEAFDRLVCIKQEKEEDLGKYANRIRVLLQTVSGQASSEYLQQQAIHVFFKGCLNKTAALAISGGQFKSLDEAVHGLRAAEVRVESLKGRVEVSTPSIQVVSVEPRKCWNCGSESHEARNCPEQIVCYTCRRSGHISSECPEARRGGGSRDSRERGRFSSRDRNDDRGRGRYRDRSRDSYSSSDNRREWSRDRYAGRDGYSRDRYSDRGRDFRSREFSRERFPSRDRDSGTRNYGDRGRPTSRDTRSYAPGRSYSPREVRDSSRDGSQGRNRTYSGGQSSIAQVQTRSDSPHPRVSFPSEESKS